MATVCEKSPLDLLSKYDGFAPRYTSYPPANFIVKNPEEIDFQELIQSSNQVGPKNLSFYFHVPFCPQRCTFCGCHTEIGRKRDFIYEYMDLLPREFQLLLPHLDRSRPVTQIHFGGGTPNAVPYSALAEVLRTIRDAFPLSENTEIAIECDPSLILKSRLAELRKMGFNRISFGIQDPNPLVLQAVNRRPSRLPHPELVQAARDLGFFGINLDLIYGLPFQTRESFRATVDAIIEANPDRVSLFPYAHVPWIKGHQSVLEQYPMPDAPTRLDMAVASREAFLRAGYVAIGMDHFAKPEDELAQAMRAGRLHRNFQGYCVAERAGQVHALGASGISQLHQGYLQNEKDLDRYRSQVEAGHLPFAKAYRMRPQDLAVRGIINGLLCRGRSEIYSALEVPGLDSEWKLDYVADSYAKLEPFVTDGIAERIGDEVRITETGFLLSRMVAAAFDPLIRSGQLHQYSRVL